MRTKAASPLARLRDAQGLTLVQLAARAKVCIDTVRRIERLDIETLQIGCLARVAWALGVAPADLIPGLESPPRKVPVAG